MEIPDNLYHYTSIESLVYILSTQEIKFNRLDKMDDILEGDIEDIKNISQYYYISSWTEDNIESIPFWKMYTPNMKGVRIALPPFPFIYYSQEKNNSIKLLEHQEITDNNNLFPVHPKLFFTNYKFNREISAIFFPCNDYLYKIEYVEYDNYNKPEYCFFSKGITGLNNNIGKVKISQWKFQKEWRYRLNFIPWIFFSIENSKSFKEKFDIWSNDINEKPNNIEQIYMKISDNAFKKMEITLGPNTTKADKLIVESIVDKYNPNILISESQLKGKVR